MQADLTRPRALAMLAVVLAATVPYLPTLHDYFVQDDFGVVWLLAQKPWSYFPRWFVSPWMDDIWGYTPDELRPFPALTYQVAALWNAASPVPNHVMNIGFHAANGLLVLWIARTAAGVTLTAAAFAGIVFAVLPIQAESVAWITGRVDSLPACAYFGAFLLYASWRGGAGRSAYVWSLVLCFVGLFSKQNTITLAPALVLYDLIIVRRRLRPLWKWLLPYVPYVALTAGFLLLRYVRFGEAAREGVLTAQRFHDFMLDVSRHLRRLIYGDAHMGISMVRAATILVIGLAGVWFIGLRYRRAETRRLTRPALYFGIVWMVLGVAPILVSGYYSPRHMYLASLGWAVLCGIAFDLLYGQPDLVDPSSSNRREGPSGPSTPFVVSGFPDLSAVEGGRTVADPPFVVSGFSRTVTGPPPGGHYVPHVLRAVAVAGAIALVTTYAMQLRDVVHDWNTRAAVSRQAVADLEREAMTMPEGTLVIAGAPTRSWAFALPFAAQPPFMRIDASTRLYVVSHSSLNCCQASQWNEYTRHALQAWRAQAPGRPVAALRWDARTGARTRLTDMDEAYLRPLMTVLIDTDSRASLDEAILNTLNALVVPGGR